MTFYKNKKEKTFDNKNIINQYKKLINNISNDFKFNISVLEKEERKFLLYLELFLIEFIII